MAITLANFQEFVTSLETSIKNDVPSFQGFGSTLSSAVAGVTVDVEKLFNWGLNAFELSGNTEATVIAPIATWAEGIINSIEADLGITTSGAAPASVTAAAAAIVAGTSAAIPAAPAPAPAPAPTTLNTGDGTKAGDDPDAGAIGG